MNKSFLLIISILTVFVLLDRGLTAFLNQIEEEVLTGQTVGKVNMFFELKDSINLIVFGSSRAQHHVVNYSLDESSYNMGMDGTGLSFASALISSLSRSNQVVLVQIDADELFGSKVYKKDCTSLKNLYFRNDDIHEYINNHSVKMARILFLFHTYSYNTMIFGIIKNRIKPGVDYSNFGGYDPIIPTEEQMRIFSELLRQQRHDFISSEDRRLVDSESDLYITEIQKKCYLNDSKLIFFTSPKLYPTDTSTQMKVKEYFNHKGIEYLDCSNHFSDFHLEYWKDPIHLTDLGAHIFTRNLKDMIIEN